MTKKEMQQLQKTIDEMKAEMRVLKAIRKNMLTEISNIGKAYDKIKMLVIIGRYSNAPKTTVLGINIKIAAMT